MITTKEDYDKIIEKLKELVKTWGLGSVYMVGGCVRDEILGLLPKDIDLVIDYPNGSDIFVDFLKDNFEDICSGFTKYPNYGTAKFTLCYKTNNYIDIECVIPRTESYDNCFRKPSSIKYTTIEEDALRRDFCCNALYKNILTGEILDPTKRGLEDLNKKILKTPLDPIQTFKDDPLRMLRAIRFFCNKSFKISPEVLKNLKPNDEFFGLSMERIRDEFEKILMSPNPVDGIQMLRRYDFLNYILPGIICCYDFDQKSKYHSHTLLGHTFKVLEGVMNIDKEFELELRWAALLHDIGKPYVVKVNPSGQNSYHKHELKSASMTRDILTHLKYGNDFIDRVCILVENHMCIKQLYNYETKQYTGKPEKTRKIALKFGNLLRPLMELIDSDNKAHAPEYCMDNQIKSFWENYEKYVINSDVTKKDVHDIINGDEIMTIFNLTPGRNIRDIKQIIQDIYLTNLSLTKDDLIKIIKEETENVELWISKDKKGYLVNVNEPTFIKDSQLFTLEEGGIDLGELQDYDYFNLELNTKEKKRAIECMNIYRTLKNRKKAEKILQKINNLAQDLLTVKDFESLTISYDTSNYFSAKICWNDNRISTYDA
jgi:putative nucleotidyltransferase with HDIG domain